MARPPIIVTSLLGLGLGLGLGHGLGHAAPPAATAKVAAAPTPAPSVEIAFERYTLANGLEVILHQDRSAPQVAVNLWYHVGSGDEEPGRSGFAHLFEHMMFQGAKHIGEDVHFDILREIGGTGINGTTNSDRTNYFEIVPSHHIETALWLESDRMGYLLDLLNAESLANQQEVVRNERRQRYDNVPYGLDRFAVAAAFYPEGHPYRYLTIGRHEDLEAASLEDVRDFFTTWYVPSNATLTLAGDFEIATAKALVERWFGTFPALPKPERREVAPPPLEATVRQELRDPFARLVRLHYAWLSPKRFGPGDLELDALSDVLGSTGWGRLYRALVVDRDLAQQVSVYQWSKGFNGEFHLVVDLKPGADLAEVEAVIGVEVARVLAEPISEAELRRVTVGAESSFVWSLEELMSRVERLQLFNHYVGDPGYTAEYLRQIRTLTPGAIHAAAKTWLARPRVEIVTIPANPAPNPGPAPAGPKTSSKSGQKASSKAAGGKRSR